MNHDIFCPQCGSDDISTSHKRQLQRCADCQHEWPLATSPPDLPYVSLSNVTSEPVRQFCKNLAATAQWVAVVENDWPAPIAHEYYRLRELLAEGQLVSAIWQLKDVAEILIKFPAIVMAQTVLSSPALLPSPSGRGAGGEGRGAGGEGRGAGGEGNLVEQVQASLLAKPLSMGDWHRLAGDILAPALLPSPSGRGAGGEGRGAGGEGAIAQFFRATPKRPTTMYQLLLDLNNWRNEQLGHGALRLDVSEFQEGLVNFVADLNQNLATHQGMWQGLSLQIATTGEVLHGWQPIRKRHEAQVPGSHQEEDVALQMQLGTQVLALSPLATLKRCTVCQKQDVFIFDSRKTNRDNKDQHQVYFLDYLAGHKMSRPSHLVEPLLAMAVPISEETVAEDISVGGDYAQAALDKLLQEKSLEAQYLSPGYLRTPLQQFIDDHDHGVFWLQAPAHLGKSIFVEGLLPERRLEKTALVPELKVVAFHIRREYRYEAVLVKDYLTDMLKQTLDLRGVKKELPQLALDAPDAGAAFGQWLGQWLTIYQQVHRRAAAKLLVCLDGLDELVSPLTASESRRVLDFVPVPDQLPTGCYLLLTSRPQAGCPYVIWQQLQAWLSRVGTGEEAMQVAEIALDKPEYVALLRQFFDRELKARLQRAVHEAISQFYRDHQGLPDLSPVIQRISDTAWRKLVKDEYDRVVAVQHCQPTSKNKPWAKAFFSQVVEAVQQQFEESFQQVLQQSEQRFLYVSYLCSLLHDYQLPLTAVVDLPSGAGLYSHYLQELEQSVAVKQWEWLKRLLIMLTVAEAAVVKDVELRMVDPRSSSSTTSPTSPSITPQVESKALDWRGLPLDVLASLLGETTERSARLVFALYSLKEVLWVDKSAAVEARYRLGLKGLSETLQQRWQEALREAHRQLAQEFHQQWQGRYAELSPTDPGTGYRFRYLLAHTALSEDKGLMEEVWGDEELAGTYFQQGVRAYEKADYRAAVAWYDCALRLYDHLHRQQGERFDLQNDLATVYMNRGNAWQGQGDLAGAVRDYGAAIALRTTLRDTLARLGPDWPPAFQNDLAKAYWGRGVALRGQGDLAGAVRDYGAAIELMTTLRDALARLGPDWPPQFQNDLASVYVNRGVALDSQGDLAGAVRDYGAAIALMTTLRDALARLGQDWPPAFQNDLASVYLNRGVALASQGDLAGAVRDCGAAIALRTTLRDALARLGQDWPPAFQNDLAKVYQNRGVALDSQGDLAGAVRDYGAAIALMTTLRDALARLGQDWPPAFQNDLAMVYMNRGNVLGSQGDLAGAVRDYGATIELMTTLRDTLARLGQDWPPEFQNDLANVYMNRGVALKNQGDLAGAVRDYGEAIELRTTLRDALARLGQDWPPAFQNDLAKVYHNRGLALDSQGDLAGAVRDYGAAIALMTTLLFDRQFAPALPDLAMVYYNLVLLSQRENLPATLSAEALQTQAREFLMRLEERVAIAQLPEHWRREVEDLRGVLGGKGKVAINWWRVLLILLTLPITLPLLILMLPFWIIGGIVKKVKKWWLK